MAFYGLKPLAIKLGLIGAAAAAEEGPHWSSATLTIGHFVLGLLGLVGMIGTGLWTLGAAIYAQGDRMARFEERQLADHQFAQETRSRQVLNEGVIADLKTQAALREQSELRMAQEHAQIYAAIAQASAGHPVAIYNAPGNGQAQKKK